MRSDGALAYMVNDEVEVETDNEIDLLADTEADICPTCGSLLIEQDDEDLLPHCPVCDRQFR